MPTGSREEHVGRGYGITAVQVADFAPVGAGHAMHVIADGKALCGAGLPSSPPRVTSADARAVRVENHPVCSRCRARLGHVPAPHLVKEIHAA